jgi:hypothetical protein
LVPDDPRIAELFGFCLGLALARYGLLLHAAVVMSNHYHLDVTDTLGKYPEFKCMFNALMARGMNQLRNRVDKFWSQDRPCDVELVTDDDVLNAMVYTVTNPTSASLVKNGARWPGFTTYGLPFGTVMRFKRPDFFFDEHNSEKLPEVVEVHIVRPDIFPELDDDALFQKFMDQVAEREKVKQAKLSRVGKRFMGEKKVCRQAWRRQPVSAEDRYTLTPKVSSRSKWARIARLQRNREWEDRYAEAYEAHLAKKRAVFPEGTYWLQRFAAVDVACGPP